MKCGEERPVCRRCQAEHRECSYPEHQTGSPAQPLYVYRESSWSSEGDVRPPVASGSSAGRQEKESARQHLAQDTLSGIGTGVSEPTQYDDWLAFLFGTSAQGTPNTELDSSISEWMSNSILAPEASTFESIITPSTSLRTQRAPHPVNVSGAKDSFLLRFSSEQQRRMADSTLQQRLRELCTSDVQLEAVSQCEFQSVLLAYTTSWLTHSAVFNFVAQCFHLLTAEINSWRRVYAELSCQSPLTLNLVTCVGLISLSQIGPVNRRPLAYALLTKSISEWQSIVSTGLEARFSTLSELQVMEVIAGAILIGHVEQFDTGLAVHTIACMIETRRVVDAVVREVNRNVNLGQGSHFRFLLRVFLWWDTLSRTMGSGSGGIYPKNAFDLARYWEEDEGEEVIETSQCISGWPLDLLEAVARTQALSSLIEANHGLHSASTRIEMRAIESQMRNCRPKVVFQDTKHTILIAELRYIVYEALQAASHIYFARKLVGSTKGVHKDIEKVIGFLNRREHRSNDAGTRIPSATIAAAGEEEELVAPINSPQSRPFYLTSVMKKRGIWKERAPDGALLWAYLQSAMAVQDDLVQNACRQTLSRWETFKDFGAVSLQFELLELIWERKRQDVEHRFTEEEIWKSVLSERRWRQLLIF